MNANRFIKCSMNLYQKRSMGGWIHKNIRVEENAGLREIGYKKWEFDFKSTSRLVIFMIIPAIALFYATIAEKEARDKQMKITSRRYGIFPGSIEKTV